MTPVTTLTPAQCRAIERLSHQENVHLAIMGFILLAAFAVIFILLYLLGERR